MASDRVAVAGAKRHGGPSGGRQPPFYKRSAVGDSFRYALVPIFRSAMASTRACISALFAGPKLVCGTVCSTIWWLIRKTRT